MADQAVAVELPAVITEAHCHWLAVTRIPLQSLRFCIAAPAPASGHDGPAPGLPVAPRFDLCVPGQNLNPTERSIDRMSCGVGQYGCSWSDPQETGVSTAVGNTSMRSWAVAGVSAFPPAPASRCARSSDHPCDTTHAYSADGSRRACSMPVLPDPLPGSFLALRELCGLPISALPSTGALLPLTALRTLLLVGPLDHRALELPAGLRALHADNIDNIEVRPAV